MAAAAALRVRGWTPPRFGADAELAPDSAFDVQMRERVRGLEDGLKEVKDRVNNLIFLVVGAVVVQVVLGFVSVRGALPLLLAGAGLGGHCPFCSLPRGGFGWAWGLGGWGPAASPLALGSCFRGNDA